MRRRPRALLLALASLLILAIALPTTASAGSSGNTGKIRAFHDSPDTPAVDIWVDGAKALSGVVYGDLSPYVSLPLGKHRIEVKVSPSDADDPAALKKTIRVTRTPKTIAAIGSLSGDGASLRLKVLNDRKSASWKSARVRVAHTSPDAPAVDIQVRRGDRWVRVIRDLSFGESSRYLHLPAIDRKTKEPIPYDIRIVAAGTDTVVLALDDVVLPKRRALTVWAVGFLTPEAGLPGFGVRITPDGRDAF